MSSQNVQNFPKEGVEIVLEGQQPKFFDLRSCIKAPPGYKLLIADFSQIEARVCPYLAGDETTLDMVRQGMNVYEVHARLTMDYVDPMPLKKFDKDLYALAKARRLALQFQAGWMRFRDQAQLEYGVGLDWPAEKWKFQVKDFRAKEPKIVRLWNRLDQDFKSCVGGNYEIELPSGRLLTYYDVTAGIKTTKVENPSEHEPAEKSRASYKAREEINGPFKWQYGGKFCNNSTQGTARDVFGAGLLRVEDHRPDLIYLWPTHDEGVWLAKEDDDTAKRDIEQILSVTPDWISGCPIGAEVTESLVY